jgi:DNA-binding response OmpR family regulator
MHISDAMKGSQMSKSILSGVSVLCIDNYIDSLEVLRLTLQLEGATVYTATSSDEALFHLKRSPVDIVISDLLMPNENGIEVLQKLRAAGFNGPAVALTCLRDGTVEAGALIQGFSVYLNKPVEIDELIAGITGALSTSARKTAS